MSLAFGDPSPTPPLGVRSSRRFRPFVPIVHNPCDTAVNEPSVDSHRNAARSYTARPRGPFPGLIIGPANRHDVVPYRITDLVSSRVFPDDRPLAHGDASANGSVV